MTNLSKKELIGWLDSWIYKSYFKFPEEKQAYKQIKKLIKAEDDQKHSIRPNSLSKPRTKGNI